MNPAAQLLAAPSGEAAKAGPFAILVIALLSIACYFIFRSMSKHLRRVREEFPYGAPPAADDADAAAPADGTKRDDTAPPEQPNVRSLENKQRPRPLSG